MNALEAEYRQISVDYIIDTYIHTHTHRHTHIVYNIFFDQKVFYLVQRYKCS